MLLPGDRSAWFVGLQDHSNRVVDLESGFRSGPGSPAAALTDDRNLLEVGGPANSLIAQKEVDDLCLSIGSKCRVAKSLWGSLSHWIANVLAAREGWNFSDDNQRGLLLLWIYRWQKGLNP